MPRKRRAFGRKKVQAAKRAMATKEETVPEVENSAPTESELEENSNPAEDELNPDAEKSNHDDEKSNSVEEISNSAEEKSAPVNEKSSPSEEKLNSGEEKSKAEEEKVNAVEEMPNSAEENSNDKSEDSTHTEEKSDHAEVKSNHANEKSNSVEEKAVPNEDNSPPADKDAIVAEKMSENQPDEESTTKDPALPSVSEDKDKKEEPVSEAGSSSGKQPSTIYRGEGLSRLLFDDECLHDINGGYRNEENLKMPLKGFTADDEVQLFPVIESMSAKLFNIVQKLINCHKKDVEAAIKQKKGVIKIPNSTIKAYLCHVKFMEVPESDKSPTAKRTPHPFLLSEDENVFTDEKLKLLRAVLDAGWRREVVMRSPGSTGRKTGDVYYYSPDNVKFRSSKQVAQHLAQLQDTPFTIENFSFAKVRISTNPDQEIVRKAYDGKSPPRAPPKPTTSKAKPQANKAESSKAAARPSTSRDLDFEARSGPEESVKAMSSRRSIQPPKRYSGDAVLLLSKRSKMDDKHRGSNSNKGLMQMGMLPPKYPKGVEDSSSNLTDSMDYMDQSGQDNASMSNSDVIKEIAEDSLFQISALRQSGGIDVDSMHHYVASQKQLAQKAVEVESPERVSAGGSKRGGGPLIPCSIRCPGMAGVVPTLHCTHCLCLYHPECLGLPPNLLFNQYICSNCTEQSASNAAQGNTIPQKNMIMKKPGEVRRQPPGLAPIPRAGVRRSIAGHRDLTVTVASKEHAPVRLPHRAMPVGAGRGMIRSRGGMMSHMRSPSAQMHSAPRKLVPEGAQMSMVVKRGRGRPPTVPSARSLPQISKNVSIQSLPRIHGAPPVPNLQPMSTPKVPGKLQLPGMGAKPRPGVAVPAVPNLMKSSAFRLTVPPPSLSGRTFKKLTPQSHPAGLRLNPTAMMGPRAPQVVHDRPNAIKRYPQSICTIGGKKYVVLPKQSRVNTEYVVSSMVAAVGNGGVPRGNLKLDEVRNVAETVVKRVSTSSSADDRTNNSDGGISQNSSAREEADGQSVNDSMEVSTDEAGGVDGDVAVDGTEEGVEVNSTNEAVAANP